MRKISGSLEKALDALPPSVQVPGTTAGVHLQIGKIDSGEWFLSYADEKSEALHLEGDDLLTLANEAQKELTRKGYS